MRRVYFDFESDNVADVFMDDVSDWLCERIEATPEFREQAALELSQLDRRQVTMPRYWLYEDASASAERVHDDHESSHPSAGAMAERAQLGSGGYRHHSTACDCEYCRTLRRIEQSHDDAVSERNGSTLTEPCAWCGHARKSHEGQSCNGWHHNSDTPCRCMGFMDSGMPAGSLASDSASIDDNFASDLRWALRQIVQLTTNQAVLKDVAQIRAALDKASDSAVGESNRSLMTFWKKVASDMHFALWYEGHPLKRIAKARAIFESAARASVEREGQR